MTEHIRDRYVDGVESIPSERRRAERAWMEQRRSPSTQRDLASRVDAFLARQKLEPISTIELRQTWRPAEVDDTLKELLADLTKRDR